MNMLYRASTIFLIFFLSGSTYAYLWDCYDETPGRSTRAETYACATAIMSTFPNSQEVGLFHRGGDDDMFQLPRVATYRECQVTIDITDVPFVTSWAAVWSMANMLKDGCARRSGNAILVKGVLRAGVTVSMGNIHYGILTVNGTDGTGPVENGTVAQS